MDGFKRRLNASIQLKLSFTLSLAILIVAIVAGVFSFVSAFNEAHELQDDTLREVAVLFNRQQLSTASPDEDRAKDSDIESRVIAQYLSEGVKVVGKKDARVSLPLPVTLSDGLHTLDVGDTQFRVLAKTLVSGSRIAVSQETRVRDEIARNSAIRTLMPFLILVPVLLLLVSHMVRKMFRPITALTTEIEERDDHELHPIEDCNVPTEVRSFVVAINRLLTRVAKSRDAQRRFVADAAHELRSPFTALSLQAERLAGAEMSAQAQERLDTLRRGVERGRNLLNQLLTLSKMQATTAHPNLRVSIQAVYRRVLEDLMPLAESKRINLGVDGATDVKVSISELDLITLVRNLVDNAIRYTPENGRVDLSVTKVERHVVLRIQDTGPGIPLAERERVFDPFYRSIGNNEVGSGLGMSIVKTIADRIGAVIELRFTDALNEFGLCVSLLIPLAKT